MKLFVTFEGIDYSGKTVQARLFTDRLTKKGVAVVLFRDPGATQISEKIREILLDKKNMEMSPWTELLLYEAARAQMIEQLIQPALISGKMVVCDRLYDSTTAYQGYGRQLDLETVKQANKIGACGLEPDLTFLIDLKPIEAQKRKEAEGKEADRIEGEDLRFQHRVRDGYLRIAAQEPDRVLVVDGQRNVEEINEEIWQIFASKYPQVFLRRGERDV